MLLEIKTYLMTHSKVSLHELAYHLGASQDVIRPMVEIWIEKGCVARCKKASHCGTRCMQCVPQTVEWFEWINNDTIPACKGPEPSH